MKTTWESVELERVASFVGGGTPSRNNADFFGGSIPWVTPKDMKQWEIRSAEISITQAGLDNSATRMVPSNSVLIVVRSGVLKHTIPVAVSRVPVAINQDMKALLCAESVHPDYVARFIKERTTEILTWVRATTADNFPLDRLKKLRIPLPSLAEQRRISAILDQADALRAKRRQAIAGLNTLTQSIFFEMFGDPMKPDGRWPMTTLGECVTQLAYGPRFYNESYSQDGVRIVRITDLDDEGVLDFEAMPRMKVSAEDVDSYGLRAGDVIFARSGSVGKSAVFPSNAPTCIAGAYFIVMRFKNDILPLFARSVLAAPNVQRFIAIRAQQAIQPNFSGPGLRALPMPCPPVAVQKQFLERVTMNKALIQTHYASLGNLDALFASLQQRLFRGES